MFIVIIPIVILLAIILIKKLPVVGGNIQFALVVTGVAALLLGGVYSPVEWLFAWVDGLDRLAWIIALAVFGSIYAETQVRMGTMNTVINVLRSVFGHSPKGLIVCVVLALTIAGSLLGDAIAASTVIGVLVINSLLEMKMKPEQIACTIVMGASLGSIMPPITQSIMLSASLVGLPSADPVMNISYITVGIGVLICSLYVAFSFIKIKALPDDLIPQEGVGAILAREWKNLIPLAALFVLVILRTGFKIDIATLLFGGALKTLGSIKILKGAANLIVVNIIMATLVAFLFASVRRQGLGVFKTAVKNVIPGCSVQLAAALMLGAFYKAGQIEAVKEFASALNPDIFKFGGAFSMLLIGMLTGSQSTAQNTIFSFFGPALTKIGVDGTNAAVSGAHLAMAGQGMPPADLTTFVVCSLVGGLLNKKVDPVKAMLLNLPMCVYFTLAGFVFMYI
ncbi:MAG: TRAP transporter large permease subunit [Spirochaetales bacterium]|jgi:TRAP-type C4-dicarboxylate transport system permease large subunit|nr:TRAP transporter large permease subunit [Spirochaetales bacterium]